MSEGKVIKKLIIVNGLWASGKSTLAAALSERHSLPALSHDSIKERLFDDFPLSGIRHLVCFNERAYERLFRELALLLQKNRAVVLDAMFDKRITEQRFHRLAQELPLRSLQIFLSASLESRVERASSRAMSGRRHSMHGDAQHDLEWLVGVAHRVRRFRTGYTPATHRYFSEPLALGHQSDLIRVDADHVGLRDVDIVSGKIAAFLDD